VKNNWWQHDSEILKYRTKFWNFDKTKHTNIEQMKNKNSHTENNNRENKTEKKRWRTSEEMNNNRLRIHSKRKKWVKTRKSGEFHLGCHGIWCHIRAYNGWWMTQGSKMSTYSMLLAPSQLFNKVVDAWIFYPSCEAMSFLMFWEQLE